MPTRDGGDGGLAVSTSTDFGLYFGKVEPVMRVRGLRLEERVTCRLGLSPAGELED